MSIRVIYLTAGRNSKTGEQSWQDFPSLEAAKSVAFPSGTFAVIRVHDGRHVYHSARFGWEFQKAA